MPRLAVNGVELAYEVAGAGEPLLLIPGTGGNRRTWRNQIPIFGERYRVLAVDLRGGGQSDQPAGSYAARLLADDLAAFLQALGVERAHVIGTSLGGAIAQELAIRYPTRVASLVLNSTWDRTDSYPYLKRQFEVRRRLVQEAPWPLYVAESSLWIFSPAYLAEHSDAVAAFERDQLANPPALHGLVGHFDADLAHDCADRLAQIQVPTLIISGEDDLITRPICAAALQAAIPAATLTTFPRVGHLTQLEAPAELEALVLSFLGSVQRAEGGSGIAGQRPTPYEE